MDNEYPGTRDEIYGNPQIFNLLACRKEGRNNFNPWQRVFNVVGSELTCERLFRIADTLVNQLDARLIFLAFQQGEDGGIPVPFANNAPTPIQNNPVPTYVPTTYSFGESSLATFLAPPGSTDDISL